VGVERGGIWDFLGAQSELGEAEAERSAAVRKLSDVKLQLQRDASELASQEQLLSERHRAIKVRMPLPFRVAVLKIHQCQADKSDAATVSKTRELKKRYGLCHKREIRHVGSRLPCELTTLLSARRVDVLARGLPRVRLSSLTHTRAARRYGPRLAASRGSTGLAGVCPHAPAGLPQP